jgi:uncharacterized tellurite resistance protein B-like protein
MLFLDLAAVVAASDGSVSETEERHLRAQLEQSLHLSAPEGTRLAAHLRWLLAAPPGVVGLKKRLQHVPLEGRREIARFAVLVAGADARIGPEEVKVLQMIYTMLGIEPERVYSDLHELAGNSGVAPAQEPVTIKSRGSKSREFAVPRMPANAEKGRSEGDVALDMERVRRTLAQTAEVSSLLASIFSQPESEPPARLPDEPEACAVAGLDGAHSAFLRELARQGTWTREDLGALAEAHGLFPDGAIETLNEAAFERCDGPLLEEEDGIVVNEDTLKVMLA